jgi:hypothetical protein
MIMRKTAQTGTPDISRCQQRMNTLLPVYRIPVNKKRTYSNVLQALDMILVGTRGFEPPYTVTAY